MNEIKVIDTTLREGMQAPGVRFNLSQTVEIAENLVELGIDTIECGHPFVSKEEFQRVKTLVEMNFGVEILAHARALKEDIIKVEEAGADWVGIFLGLNEYSLKYKYGGISESKCLEKMEKALSFAKSTNLKIRFTLEDFSRTNFSTVRKVLKIANSFDVDRFCISDTVGIYTPNSLQNDLEKTLKLFSKDIEVHLHNDRGFANANAITSCEKGATWISSSINGIGERCGITDTGELLVNIASLGKRAFPDLHLIKKTEELVAAYSRLPINLQKPITGKYAFQHTCDLHRKAVKQNRKSYEWISTPFKKTDICDENSIKKINNIIFPKVISCTELKHHKSGPGNRYVMIDDRFYNDCRQYCIVRRIPQLENYGSGHVNTHRHKCDSLFLFIGTQENLQGLKVEVQINDSYSLINSPASVFIPAGVYHSYKVIDGEGIFVNHVLNGNYNESLLE